MGERWGRREEGRGDGGRTLGGGAPRLYDSKRPNALRLHGCGWGTHALTRSVRTGDWTERGGGHTHIEDPCLNLLSKFLKPFLALQYPETALPLRSGGLPQTCLGTLQSNCQVTLALVVGWYG